jgi:hypothetical protein
LIRISVHAAFPECIFGCIKMDHKRFVTFFQIHNLQLRSHSTPVTLHELESFFRCTENNNMDKCHEILNVFHIFLALDKCWYKSNSTVFNMIKSQIQNQDKF